MLLKTNAEKTAIVDLPIGYGKYKTYRLPARMFMKRKEMLQRPWPNLAIVIGEPGSFLVNAGPYAATRNPQITVAPAGRQMARLC